MSKKKNKYKKQIKARILAEMTQGHKDTTTKPELKKDRTEILTDKIIDNTAIQNLNQIKYDLKKTGIVITGLALTILVLVIIDQKNGILLKFGNWLFKIFNIQ